MINKKLVNPEMMWLIVLLGMIVTFNLAPAERLMPANTATYVLVISAVVYWMYFFTRGLVINRQAVQGSLKTEKLIQTGVYGVVRHPIYGAYIVLAWGIFLFFPTLKVLASVVWLTLVLLFWMRQEELVLTEKFGEEYLNYKKKVPMFLPKIFKR